MSSCKKMKRMVVFDSSSYEDHHRHMARRLKHQTLFQDYMDLHQETEAARNNLMALKRKQLTLQAEVRFLRQRHKFLLKNKSSTSQEQVFIKPQLTQSRKNTKGKLHFKMQSTSHNLPYAEKKKASRSILSADFDSILGKQQSVQRVVANQRVRVTGPASPFHDLNQKDDIFGSQELVGQNRKPVIDLNQICRDVESQSRCEPFDSLTKGLISNGLHEQHTDVQFPIGRNLGGGSVLGSGSSGRAKKRKISWQDPVAVTV